MAEESQGQEKTEEPTPRKREKAREEGQVARSRELVTMALLVAGTATLILLGPSFASTLIEIGRSMFQAATMEPKMIDALGYAANRAIVGFAPFFVVVMVVGGAASAAMGGVTFAPKALAFKGNRISPARGFKRMFSVRALAELGKTILKVLTVAGVAIAVLYGIAEDVLSLSGEPLRRAMQHGLSIVAWSLLGIAISLVIIALVDVPLQLQQFKKQLRMSRQEVKDELKDSEGKPEVKNRIRQLQQEVSRRRMMRDVPDADVVITNPEHFSVALKYDAQEMGAPKLLAKGVDLIALKIREIAAANDVPMVQAPPLARAVYHSTEVGDEVPEDLYVAVAQVLAYIYQLDRARKGVAAAPQPLGDIEVPEGYGR